MRRTKTEGRTTTRLYQELAAKDADFQVRRSPRFVSQHRPEYIAAATAIREREKNSLVPAPQQPQFRPKEAPGRLRDLSQWYASKPTRDSDEEDAAETSGGTDRAVRDENEDPREEMAVVRERFQQSRSRFHDLRDSAQKTRPPSPSLAKSSVKRRLAAVRQRFVSAVNSGVPPSPRFGGSSSEAEDDEGDAEGEEEANSFDENERRKIRQHDKENRNVVLPARDETDAFFASPSSARKKSSSQVARNFSPRPSTHRRTPGVTSKEQQPASPVGHAKGRVSFSKVVEFDVPLKGGDDGEEDEGDSDFTYKPSDEEEEEEEEEEYEQDGGSCPKYDFDLIPDHLRDNPDILLGYRAYYSTGQCLRSVFSVHNDTGNIWIRLLSGFAFANLAYSTVTSPFYYYTGQSEVVVMPLEDRLYLSGYAAAVAFSFMCSAMFYVFRAHRNFNVFYWSSILEYSSTVVMFFGHSASALHFVTYCYPHLHDSYIGASAAVSIVGFLTPWTGLFYSRAFRKFQNSFRPAVMFALLSIAVHAFYTVGIDQSVALVYDAWWVFAAIGCYLVGSWFHEGRRPELWFPGKFDTFTNSTQLCQIGLSLTGYCVWQILIQMAEVRIAISTHACPIGKTAASQADQYAREVLARVGRL